MCLSYSKTTSGQNLNKIKQYLGEQSLNAPKIDHFMDTESIRKTLKTFNFTTTNAIPMKLTTDIYLTKVFHLPKSLGVAQRV